MSADATKALRLAVGALAMQRPHCVCPRASERTLAAARDFLLGGHAVAAVDTGWTPGALLDVPRCDRRGGALWRLRGRHVVAVETEGLRLNDGELIPKPKEKAA